MKAQSRRELPSFVLALRFLGLVAIACGPVPDWLSRASYSEREVTFRNARDGIRLSGSLTLPVDPGPHPGVVLLHGSGPATRDAEVGPHRLFFDLADHLSRHSIAVLRYDKRGCGRSEGTYVPYDLENSAEDGLAALAWLRNHEAVDPDRVGALGISMGGLVVPLMASRSSDVAFAVLLAAPGVWGEEFFRASSVAVARASGFKEPDFARIRQLYAEIWPLWSKLSLSAAETARATDLLRELTGFMDAEARAAFGMNDIDAYFARTRSGRFLSTLGHDPAEVLKQVRCPVLSLIGSRDVHVSPPENLDGIRKALRASGNRNYKVLELEGLNHLLQRCRTGLPQEYFTIKESMAPEALETISTWILEVAG